MTDCTASPAIVILEESFYALEKISKLDFAPDAQKDSF